jgi:hypothetical protein
LREDGGGEEEEEPYRLLLWPPDALSTWSDLPTKDRIDIQRTHFSLCHLPITANLAYALEQFADLLDSTDPNDKVVLRSSSSEPAKSWYSLDADVFDPSDKNHELHDLVFNFINNFSPVFEVNPNDDLVINQWPFSWFTSPLYWIDAICINQNDEDEKMQEIARMGDIYTKAEVVTAWLGKLDVEAEVAALLTARVLPDLLIAILNHPDDESRAEFLREYNPLAPAYGEFGQYDTKYYNKTFWAAVWCCYHDFIRKRTWFSRVWVMQEVVLARKIQLLCGSRWLDWDLITTFEKLNHDEQWFSKFKVVLKMGPDFERTRSTSLVELWALKLGRHIESDRPSGALSVALKASRKRFCTFPEDRLYGILGILGAYGCHELVHKFSRSKQDIHRLRMELSVSLYTTGDLLFLQSASGIDQITTPDYPSWLIDLNHADELPRKTIRGKYKASGAVSCYVEQSDNRLLLKGLRIGTIRHLVKWKGILEESLAHCLLNLYESAQQCQFEIDWKTSAPAMRDILRLAADLETLGPGISSSLKGFPNGLFSLIFHEILSLQTTTSIESIQSNWLKLSRLLFSENHALCNKLTNGIESVARETETELRDDSYSDYYSKLIKYRLSGLQGMTFFLTDSGHLGVTDKVKIEDEIWLVAGLRVPLVLRVATGANYAFVGDTFVAGAMRGELAGDMDQSAVVFSLE